MAALCLCLVLWRDEASGREFLDRTLLDHAPLFPYDQTFYRLRQEVASRKNPLSDQARTDI